MGEERRESRRFGQEERADATPRGETPASAPAKKKKKRGKGTFLFFLLLLALGAAAGLHFSGLWDARPLVWGAIPKIPYVGPSLASLFDIPERYTLTVAERRALELQERQKRLDDRERELAAQASALEALSEDVDLRADRLNRQQTAQRNTASTAEENPSDAGRKLIEQVARTYQDMSPRNAAQIVEQLSEPLAVELLQKLPVDARSSILGKMDPGRAARLTELMARAGSP